MVTVTVHNVRTGALTSVDVHETGRMLALTAALDALGVKRTGEYGRTGYRLHVPRRAR